MRTSIGPFPIIFAGLAIVAAVYHFRGSLDEMVRPLADALGLPAMVVTYTLVLPGAVLVLFGLRRAVGAAPGPIAADAARLCFFVAGAATLVVVGLLILVAGRAQGVDIGVLLWALGAAAAVGVAWYVVRAGPAGLFGLTHPERWLREATRTLRNEVDGKDEPAIQALCDTYVETQYVDSARFRRSVHYGAKQLRMKPDEALQVYRAMLYETLRQAGDGRP